MGETIMDAADAYLCQALELVVEDLPPSREASLVRTKIDEARLWLSKIEDQEPVNQ